MIKYTKRVEQSKVGKKTELLRYLTKDGWEDYKSSAINDIVEIHYIGKCAVDGDLFAVFFNNGAIVTYSGIKGDEFN